MRATGTGRGRPRSEEARRAILLATRDILRERGYERLALVDVAERAAAGRQTIYRWWPSKALLVAECVSEGIFEIPLVEVAATGDPAADLLTWFQASRVVIEDPQVAPLMRALSAASATDPRAAAALRERFARPLRAAIVAAIAAGVSRGALRADGQAEAVADLLLGVMLYAVLSDDPEVPERFPDTVAVLLSGLLAEPSADAARRAVTG